MECHPDHIIVILSEAKDLFLFQFCGGVGAGGPEGLPEDGEQGDEGGCDDSDRKDPCKVRKGSSVPPFCRL